ncbi:MAG: universal stress protein [Pseudomonadota bacterium]
MPVTTLLAFNSTDEPLAQVRQIIALAGEMDAHLNLVVFGVLVPIPTASYPGIPDVFSADAYKNAAQAAEQRAKSLEALVRESRTSASIMVECIDRGMIGRTISRHALCADVTVFPNGSIPLHDLATDAFNGVLFDASQPVLILGAGDKPLPQLDRALMAWNGEPEAASAIHNSLSLLEKTSNINVVRVRHDGTPIDDEGTAEMERFLARHAKSVSVDVIEAGPGDVADVLLEHAGKINADIIVMGAYGHSRLRQWLLGGTTRDLLSRTQLPVFMSH